jgi:hypothetical protein
MLSRHRTYPNHVAPGRAQWTILATLAFAAALFASPASATVLDFGAALQALPAGTPVHRVDLEGGGYMKVHCESFGVGPDLCIVFDSADPSDADEDLGTPNEAFGGPGEGDGGGSGARGENAVALGKVLIIAQDDEDENHDGLVDEPDDAWSGGIIDLKFSHAGRLSLSIIDVDCNEDEPRLYLYHEGNLVDRVDGQSLGDNSVQHFDFSAYGDVDAVRIHLEGSSAIAGIVLDVPQVGVESTSWSTMKSLFR